MSIKEGKTKKKSEGEVQKPSGVSIDTWITIKMSQDTKLKSSQRRELEVFLRKQGLADLEDSEKYEEAYRKF